MCAYRKQQTKCNHFSKSKTLKKFFRAAKFKNLSRLEAPALPVFNFPIACKCFSRTTPTAFKQELHVLEHASQNGAKINKSQKLNNEIQAVGKPLLYANNFKQCKKTQILP